MRVLQAPLNIANQGWMNAEALRLRGHDAEVWQFGERSFGYPADRVFQETGSPRAVVQLLFEAIDREFDVVHFHFAQSLVHAIGPLPWFWDLPIWKALGVTVVFSFHGTDVRVASIAKELDPWSAYHFADIPTDERLIRERLELIGGYADAWTISNVANSPYVPAAVYLPLSVDLREIEESPPRRNRTPIVAHAPSARGTKGTEFVLQGLEVLREKGVEFELDLIEGVSNRDVLQRYARADVVVEKLVNEGFGVAALEAMSVGRPVVSRIAPVVYKAHPDLPIVDATPDTFVDVLGGLLRSRDEIERRSAMGRAYVLANHDITLTGERLEDLYANSRSQHDGMAVWLGPLRKSQEEEGRLAALVSALERRNRQLESSDRQLESRNRQLETRNRQLEKELIEARHGVLFRVRRRARKLAAFFYARGRGV